MAEASEATKEDASPTIAALDTLLTAQIAVAWAGEAGEKPRLGWWRSDLASEYGGEDLFRRLLPHTWRWAVLQAVREAALRRDAEIRGQHHDPDQVVSLYYLGFEVDERVEERFQDLKQSGATPEEALPNLHVVIAEQWDQDAFVKWLDSHGKASFVSEPIGRRIKGAPPARLDELTGQLLAALSPPSESYPLPHFRREE
jgi:hypothetical protein